MHTVVCNTVQKQLLLVTVIIYYGTNFFSQLCNSVEPIFQSPNPGTGKHSILGFHFQDWKCGRDTGIQDHRIAITSSVRMTSDSKTRWVHDVGHDGIWSSPKCTFQWQDLVPHSTEVPCVHISQIPMKQTHNWFSHFCTTPVDTKKNRVVGWRHGYLPGARSRLAYGPADATATRCLLLQ